VRRRQHHDLRLAVPTVHWRDEANHISDNNACTSGFTQVGHITI